MPMEQEAFHAVGDFDETEVDMSVAPHTVEHYLKQVCVQRRQERTVVVAASTASSSNAGAQPTSSNQPTPEATPVAQSQSAPRAWQDRQVADFVLVRERLQTQRSRLRQQAKLPAVEPPDEQADEEEWRAFCDEHLPEQVGVKSSPSAVLAFNHPTVCTLLAYCIEWLCEQGYSACRMHRLFSLLLVLEPPLDPETCANLRQLARFCRDMRNTCDQAAADGALAREYSWFIAIVARFFGQKDLADP